MKEKILKVLKSRLLFAAVLNAAVMVLCIVMTSFSYENSKDFYNSILICSRHFYFGSGINYILAAIIGTLQYGISDINSYVLVQVALSYAAFTSITYAFADKYTYKKALIYSIGVLCVFSLNHYAIINSDKTAALLLAAGFILLLNAIRNKKYSLGFWAGFVQVILGAFFNFRYFFVALGFGIAFFLGDMIAKKKYRLPSFRIFFWYFRPYLLTFLAVTLAVAGLNQFSYSANHSSSEAADYYDYSSVTQSVDNLPYPGYAEYSEEFEQAGINSEDEYELLKNGYYDPYKSLDNNALKVVNTIQQRENTKTVLYCASDVFVSLLGHILSFDSALVSLLFFLALAVAFILYHKNRFSFFPLFYAVTGYISSVVLRYFFNGEDYVTYGIRLFMIVFLLFSFNFEMDRQKAHEAFGKTKHGKLVLSVVMLAALIGATTAAYLLRDTDVKRQPQSLMSEIERNPDCYYVMDPVSANEFIKTTENYLHPLWGFREGYLENLDSFGYFHNYDLLRKRNMPDNIYEAIMSNHKIYVIDKNITFRKEAYFSENYTEDFTTVAYRQVGEYDEYKIYEVKVQRD